MKIIPIFKNPLTPAILITIYHLDTIYWLISNWFANTQNIYGSFILISAIYLLIDKYRKNEIQFKKNISNKTLLILTLLFGASILNKVTFDFSIISGFLLIQSIIAIIISQIKFKNIQQPIEISLLLNLSLPIIFYINSVFGLLFRNFYAGSIFSILSIVNSEITLLNTTIGNAGRYLNIDTGCSGVMNMYLLACFSLFLGSYRSIGVKKTVLHIISMWTVFIIVNLIHLLTISYSYLIVGNEHAKVAHGIIAITVTVLAFVISATTIIFIPTEKKDKSKNVKIDEKSPTESSWIKNILIILLIGTTLAKYGFDILQTKNIAIAPIIVNNECKVNLATSNLNSKQLEIGRKAKASSMSKFEMKANDGTKVEIVIARVNSNLILTSVSGLLEDDFKTTFSRTINLDENEQIRTLEAENSDIAYYKLFRSDGEVLEYRVFDTINWKGEGTFIIISPEEELPNAQIGEMMNDMKGCVMMN